MHYVLDPYDNGQPVLAALGETAQPWNGWRTPIATFEQVRDFIEEWKQVDPNGIWGDVLITLRDGKRVLEVTRTDSDDRDDWDYFTEVRLLGEQAYELNGWCWVPAGSVGAELDPKVRRRARLRIVK